MLISNDMFYKYLNEGLLLRYSSKAGPIQEMNIIYKEKEQILFLKRKKIDNHFEINLIGDFIEQKWIYEDINNPLLIESHLKNIEGILFINHTGFIDLILDL